MQNIESTIVELGSIFQQLAHMVKEQEETIQRSAKHIYRTRYKTTNSKCVKSWIYCDYCLLTIRIDGNVEDTQLNVEMAHTEILKYFQSVSSNRWLMIKIFLVLIVFFIIFVVFLAWWGTALSEKWWKQSRGGWRRVKDSWANVQNHRRTGLWGLWVVGWMLIG